MAVTTRNRRFSMIGLASPILTTLPNPDAVLNIDDRPQLLKLYAGFSLTGGSAFVYEYTHAAGDHDFYGKIHRKALVIPNYVTITTPEDASTTFSGHASDSDSAILRIDLYQHLQVTSNAQAKSIANAILSHARLRAEKAFAIVPMNVGQEAFDYVKITDSWQGDYRIGNVGYIRRHYQPGKPFQMEIRLGVAVFSPLLGGSLGGGSREGNLTEIYRILEQLISAVNSILDYLEQGISLGLITADTIRCKRLYVSDRLKIPVGADKYD